MPLSDECCRRMLPKLQLLYADQAEAVLDQIDGLVERYAGMRVRPRDELWDQRSIVLITYPDQVRAAGQPALEAQRQFLREYELNQLINAVHILPFFPYSSDDGFSVIDYQQVDPQVGDWSDVNRFGESFGLMFDFVVNHCSQQHEWFQRYLIGEQPYTSYFIDVDPATDLTAVTRPRSSPLLTPFETGRGIQHVWTTFSADQIDLNFSSPELLIEALDILLLYVQHGAIAIRLDAIGFLWKQIGTDCMHLSETHAVVKLMRDLVDELAPGTILLTETNVPHKENVSYFGNGDEAHAVYQFSLSPLLLDAFLTGDAGTLIEWLVGLEYPGEGMTFFNFTASHDGIGVRPLEGLVPQERLDALVAGVRDRGGLVSMRTRPDETQTPYELNITYLSALNSPAGLPADVHARKFLASQGLMLALRGVPGIYFHSLVGTENDRAGVERTGHNRTINRRKFEAGELRQIVSETDSLQRRVFDGYRHLLAVRIAQPAFHPEAGQTIHDAGQPSVVAFERTSRDGGQRILVLVNVSDQPVTVDLDGLGGWPATRDLLHDGRLVGPTKCDLDGYDIAWLA